MNYQQQLGSAISYLESAAVGLRHVKHGELGIVLEQIARNVQSFAHGAKLAEQAAGMEIPDMLSAGYRQFVRVCDDDEMGDTHL